MTRILLYLTVALTACVFSAYGQNDSTLYINGLPVTEDDTVRDFPRVDYEPKNRLTPLGPGELPGKVLRALNKGEQYEGWKDAVVYFDPAAGIFLIPIRASDGVRIFGLNQNGDAVTYDHISDGPE